MFHHNQFVTQCWHLHFIYARMLLQCIYLFIDHLHGKMNLMNFKGLFGKKKISIKLSSSSTIFIAGIVILIFSCSLSFFCLVQKGI